MAKRADVDDNLVVAPPPPASDEAPGDGDRDHDSDVDGAARDDTDSVPAPAVLPGTEWLVQRMHGPLNRMWERGFRFLFVLDAAALLVIMFGANLARFRTLAWPDNPASFYVAGFAIAAAIHLTVNYFFGLYEREPRLGMRAWLPRALIATAIAAAFQGLASVLLDRYLMPRGNIVILVVLGSFAIAGNRRVSRALATRRQGPPRVMLVGADADIALAESHLAESDRDAAVVGRVATPAELLGTFDDCEATDVLLLDVEAFGSVFPEPLATLEDRGIGFLQRVSARETLLGLQTIRQVAGMPFVPLRSHTVASYKLRFKRLFDLVLVIALSPLWLLALGALCIYSLVRAGRPIFYRQERVGQHAVPFQVVKFRTMGRDAEQQGAQLAERNDPRVLRGFGWMRATRADEIPQLWNVLRGQMSLVGPRPERPELIAEIAQRVPGYVLREELPPGLTGLAQIHGRYSTDAEYKLGYDLQYMVNWSPVLDVEILIRTVVVVLSRRV